MKIKFLIIVFFIFSFSFAQGSKNVFEFDSSIDKMVYRNLNGKKEVSGFTVLIGKKAKFFSASPCLSKKPLAVNITRDSLTKEVEKDNARKKKNYIIYVKSINKYYTVDHIARKIED